MSAAASARPAPDSTPPKQRSVGAQPFAPTPHFFFRSLARWLTYSEHAILGIILDSTTTWRRGKWKSHWRFQSVDRLAELTATSPANIYAAIAALEGSNLIESRKIPVLGCQYRIKLRNLEGKKPDERQGLLWDVPLAIDFVQAPKCPGCGAKDVTLAYEDGYCPAPHSYFRELPSRVTYAVWLVVGVVLDRTVAANRGEDDDWEKIFLSEFERDSSLTRRTVQMALAEAQELGLIGEKESSGGASSYRVYTKRFSNCPKRPAKVIPIDSRHRSAPAQKGEEKVETVGENVAEVPQKAAKTRAMELTPIAILPHLRHGACGWSGLLPNDVGEGSADSAPNSDGKARVKARAGPPAEAKPAKKSKFDEAMERWEEKYGGQ